MMREKRDLASTAPALTDNLSPSRPPARLSLSRSPDDEKREYVTASRAASGPLSYSLPPLLVHVSRS